MSSGGQFCLRWNNHQPNMVSVFSSLMQNDQLVDVTLLAENNEIHAHKIVLSACSPYFQSLFIRNPCKHPVIILADVKFMYLKNLVEFMYNGEINIFQDHLPELLRVAELLKVKGLEEIPSFDFSNELDQQQSQDMTNAFESDTDDLRESTGATKVPTHTETNSSCMGNPIDETDEMLIDSKVHVESAIAAVNQANAKKSRNGQASGNHQMDNVAPSGQETSMSSSFGFSSNSNFRSSNEMVIDLNPHNLCKSIDGNSMTTQTTSNNDSKAVATVAAAATSKRRTNTGGKRKLIRQNENFIRALEAVRCEGIGFCKAARMHGVNNRTLWLEYQKLGYPMKKPRKKQNSS